MKKIGLTGGIGSGKSIIGKILEVMDYPVFYSDKEAKLIMTESENVVLKVKQAFGKEAYLEGELNRPYLAKKIFNDESLKATLNQIVHPAVREKFNEWALEEKTELVFNEAAILFETGAYKTFDHNVLVTAPEEVRILRVIERDNTSAKEVKERMNNQWKDAAKEKMASFVIQND